MELNSLNITNDVALGFVRGFNLIPPLHRYKSIDDSAAKILAESNVKLDLDGVTKISIIAIKHLVVRQDDLCLGIKEITDEQAIVLTEIKKTLSLNSINEISTSALKILLSRSRELLTLDGLKALTLEQVDLFNEYVGGFSLGDFTNFNRNNRNYFSSNKNTLNINSKYLTITCEVALELIRSCSPVEPIKKYSCIEDEAVSILASSNLKLELDNVRSISVEALRSISRNRDYLSLGLLKINEEEAKILSEIRGELLLNKISTISVSALKLLLKTPRKLLSLDGLHSITTEQAGLISKYHGRLSLCGIETLSNEIARLLSMHHGELLLLSINSISIDEAIYLSNHKNKVYLKSDLNAPREACYLLRSRMGVEIKSYSEIQFLEDCLSEGKDQAVDEAYKIIQKNYTNLCLDGIRSITKIAAHVLSTFPGKIQLPHIEELDNGVADCLARHIGPELELNGLKHLSSTTAEALARHHGVLSLIGLETFVDDSHELLALHHGPLVLPLPDGGNKMYGWYRVENHDLLMLDLKAVWKPTGIDYLDIAVIENILLNGYQCIQIPEEVHFISNTILARLGYALRILGIDVDISGVHEFNEHQSHLLTGNYSSEDLKKSNNKLSIYGLRELSIEAAKEFGKSGLYISISGLQYLSSLTLQNLTKNINGLSLDCLKIDNDGVKYLANVNGDLLLDGINNLYPGFAKSLSHHHGYLTLNGLRSISCEDSNFLRQHDGIVELKGLLWKQMNFTLLQSYLEKTIILNDIQVLEVIENYPNFSRWSKVKNFSNEAVESLLNNAEAPELIVRIILEFTIVLLAIGDKRIDFNSDYFSVYKYHMSIPPNMIFDNLIRYVQIHYLDCSSHQRSDTLKSIEIETKSRYFGYDFSHLLKIFDLKFTLINESRPELNKILKSCHQSAKKIMSMGLTGGLDISCETIIVLGLFIGKDLNFSSIKNLTKNGALALSYLEADIILSGLTELSTENALLLAKCKYYKLHHSFFDAEISTYYEGCLELNGIKNISFDTAKSLAGYAGIKLSLNGLELIEDDVAEALGSYKDYHENSECRTWRRLELNGLTSLTPKSANSLSGCIDQDPWDLVDKNRFEAKFSESFSALQNGISDRVLCVISDFKQLSILLAHQERRDELESCYFELRSFIEMKYGRASKPWILCVVFAAHALKHDKISFTNYIINEIKPEIESLIITSNTDEVFRPHLIDWLLEIGEQAVAHTLLDFVKSCHQRCKIIVNDIDPSQSD